MNESCKPNQVVMLATLKPNITRHGCLESQPNYQLMFDKQLEEITRLQERLTLAELKLMEYMKLKNDHSESLVK